MDCVTVIVKRVYIEVNPLGGIVKRVLRRDYYRGELSDITLKINRKCIIESKYKRWQQR